MIVSEHTKRWSEHLCARIRPSEVVLYAQLEELGGESFVFTVEEMRRLLDLLSQDNSVLSHNIHPFASESMHGSLNALLTSFAYQRAL